MRMKSFGVGFGDRERRAKQRQSRSVAEGGWGGVPRTFPSRRAFKGGKASVPGAGLVEEANLLADLSENEGGLLPVFAS